MKTLLLDGDGVLWRSDEAVPGLHELFEVVKERGINWALITNNATRQLERYVEKFESFGIEADIENIFSAASATGEYLCQRYEPGTTIFVLGEIGLVETLRSAGFDVYTGEEIPDKPITLVIAAMDRDLTYRKLDIATHLIRGGATFIGTNPDKTIPTPDGLSPGSGTMLAALVASTDVEPLIVGKPKPAIFQTAMAHFDADPATTFMVGDRLETDILGAVNAGISSILVLTGASTRDMIKERDYQPDYIFDSIAELAKDLKNV